jgi:(p)ppGpp synthase/HD superfamily hydrolase
MITSKLIKDYPTLNKAFSIAEKAHKGKTDKGGQPYILHCIRVMDEVESLTEKIVAILHDVVEDTQVSIDDLAKSGFPEKVLEALKLLTKDGSKEYDVYIDDIRLNPIARKVKLADLRDNMDVKRLKHPLEKSDLERLEKYIKAYKKLL